MNVRPMGERALLIECDDVLGMYAAVRAAAIQDVVDIVPAAATVLVRFAGPASAARPTLEALEPLPRGARDTTDVEIDVLYDGPDLAAVAEMTGLTASEVVARHVAPTYDVAFCGFAPGFAYLRGVDPALVVPRHDSPRTRVPAGSVALAAGYTGVYPRSTPGGWQLIGRTDAPLLDPLRDPPALLAPGTRVRFRAVDSLRTDVTDETSRPQVDGVLEVLAPGPFATVQDLGRPGHGAIAVGASGAFDRGALRLANRLLGNRESAAALECLGGGLTLRALAPCTVAVTGADGPVFIDDRPADRGSPLHLAPGMELRIGTPSRGLRTYLAVRGGLAVAEVLGSRAHDTMAGFGPAPLAAGDVLPVGTPDGDPLVDYVPSVPATNALDLRVVRGPRWDWFTARAHASLTGTPYTVSAQSDRIGLRLDGAVLERTPEATGRELEPEGMVRGALQVPPDGQPVLLGPDHPVTGGYPVIAAVVDADLDACAQATPGTPLHFRVVG